MNSRATVLYNILLFPNKPKEALSEDSAKTMDPIELNDPQAIEELLGKISLHGRGFQTDCLLADVYEAGLTYPDFLKAHGTDPGARYGDQSPAWANYHIRQGKKVFIVYGGNGGERRTHTTDTP